MPIGAKKITIFVVEIFKRILNRVYIIYMNRKAITSPLRAQGTAMQSACVCICPKACLRSCVNPKETCGIQ